MIISDKHKYVFISVPKTGTRSIYHLLLKDFNGKKGVDHSRQVPAYAKDFYTFLTVRNPYDRAASAYWSTCRRPKSPTSGLPSAVHHGFQRIFDQNNMENNFKNYLKIIQGDYKGYVIDHTLPISYFAYTNKIDFILRFEDIENSFNQLPFVKDFVSLPILNPTTSKTNENPNLRPKWESMVDDECISIINDVYSKDFQFGYEKL